MPNKGVCKPAPTSKKGAMITPGRTMGKSMGGKR